MILPRRNGLKSKDNLSLPVSDGRNNDFGIDLRGPGSVYFSLDLKKEW